MTPDDHVVAFVRDGHIRQGENAEDMMMMMLRRLRNEMTCVGLEEEVAGQSDEGGQDEIGQDVFRALPHVPLLRWRGIVDLRLRDAVRITFSSVLLLHFGDGLGSERFGQGGGRRRAGLFLWKEDQDHGRGEASRVRDETFLPRGLCAVE